MLLGRFGFCNRGFVKTKFRIRKKYINTAHLKNITMVATICILCIISNSQSKKSEPELPRIMIKIHNKYNAILKSFAPINLNLIHVIGLPVLTLTTTQWFFPIYTEISMMLEISGYMDLFLWNLPATNGR